MNKKDIANISAENEKGEVCFMDVRSQYTPKDMQTSAMKNKFSVKIKLLLPSASVLVPGSKVEVFTLSH